MGRKNRFDTESDDSMNREAVWIWRVKRAWSSKQEQRYSVTGEDEVGRFLRNDWKAFADAAKLAPIGWSEASRASKQFCSLQHHPANSMILSYPGRQQTAWRSCTSILGKCLYAPKTQRRRKHQVPVLTHNATLRKDGLRDVLSPDGYEIAWTRYQQFLVDKLNQLTAQTKDENTKTKDLLIKYARDPNHAALFNYASAAHNNHFFFETLTPDPTPIPSALLSHINSSFSSLETLRSHFLATADSMFGPGYVWLVKRTQSSFNEHMKLSILATYNAGSPYPGAHFRQQPVDMNTAATGVTADLSPTGYARMMRGDEGTNQMDDRLRVYGKGYGTGNPNSPPSEAAYSGTAGSFGAYSATTQNTNLHPESRRAPGGAMVEVLLGVSTWEHVWLRDWGITGKRKFLEAWWEKVDWEKVFARSGFGSGGRRL